MHVQFVHKSEIKSYGLRQKYRVHHRKFNYNFKYKSRLLHSINYSTMYWINFLYFYSDSAEITVESLNKAYKVNLLIDL